MKNRPGPASWEKNNDVRDRRNVGVQSAVGDVVAVVQIQWCFAQRSVLVLLLSLSPALHHSLAGLLSLHQNAGSSRSESSPEQPGRTADHERFAT